MKHFIILLLFTLVPAALYAQGCTVCTQTAGQLGEKGAQGLNFGILYLALLPITFISILGYVWWRHNKVRQ